MGMFDNLPSWLPEDPTQNAAARAGLLNFGAALLGGRGNIGQVLAGGLMAGAQGYNGSLEQQQQAGLAAAQQRRWDLDNQQTQAALDQQKSIAADLVARAGAPNPMNAATSLAEGASGGMVPQQDPDTLSSTPQASLAPNGGKPLSMIPQATIRPLSSLPQVDTSAPAAPSQTDSPMAFYQQALSNAQFIASKYGANAAKPYFDQAKALRPEARDIKTVTLPNGTRALAQFFNDGSAPQIIQGMSPDAEKLLFQNAGGLTYGLDPLSGKVVTTLQNTQTPDSIASNATTRRGQDLAHQDSDPQAPISDAAILNAAARYNLDGTLPPMGMGANAAAGRSAILNKAAELAAGIDPTLQRQNQLSAKGSAAAQNTAVREFSTGRLGNSVRSFNVLQSHLDTMGSMADALNNGDAQMFNKLSNTLAAQTGRAAPTNFEAVKHIVGDEIVKAVTGSAGALGDREAAAKTIASANSPAQLRGVIDTYKELARGQLTGLRQQYQASTGRDDFDKFLSPSSKAAVAPLNSLPKKQPAASGHPADISALLNKYGNP